MKPPNPGAGRFKGSKSCGCVVWLYSAEWDTPKRAEKQIADAIKSGLTVERIADTEAAVKEANQAWGECPHGKSFVADPRAEARKLLGVAT